MAFGKFTAKNNAGFWTTCPCLNGLIIIINEQSTILELILPDPDTLSFQARGFYEMQGYDVSGTLENVGRYHRHFYMKKDL